jgi:uncharacterized membrane protein
VNARRLLWTVYAVASVLMGLGAGQWFFRIFDQVVPPAVTTSFNRTTAHGYFLLNGALLGVVIALWGALAFWLARLIGAKGADPGLGAK